MYVPMPVVGKKPAPDIAGTAAFVLDTPPCPIKKLREDAEEDGESVRIWVIWKDRVRLRERNWVRELEWVSEWVSDSERGRGGGGEREIETAERERDI